MKTNTPFTAFLGGRRLAAGSLDDIARALADLNDAPETVLVFEDSSGAQVDTPPPLTAPRGHSTVDGAPAPRPERAPAPAVGRPRLGVVAREITLLPRHWEWLAEQPGGASAALRRLVDEARRSRAGSHARRLAKERTYRFMSAIAGHLPGFEEAARALFGQGASATTAFAQQIADWPPDIRAYLTSLSQGAFDTDTGQS